MSQIRNKVKWCLNKAKKEIEEGKKHRGLVEVEADINEAKMHLKKAEHNLKALILNEKQGFSDWSVSMGFYVIYHCFLGILRKNGYESRNQECTIALMHVLKEEGKTNISDDIIEALENPEHEEAHESNVIEMRENFQYGTETDIENEKITKLKELCKKAYQEAQEEIAQQSK